MFAEHCPAWMCLTAPHYRASCAWDAATEEVKKDHFKIGEEVDILSEIRARVKAKAKDGTWYTYKPADVRRITAWEPKDGDAVLFNLNEFGFAVVAVYKDDALYCGRTDYRYCREWVKPFDTDKIGKPWEEV